MPPLAALSVTGLCHGTDTEFPSLQCELTGEWSNDLGSNMTIGPVDKEGKFSGSYLTAVKDTSGNICRSPLVGFQHSPNTCSMNITFGFSINWNFSDSISVFTGQCFVDKTGKETLKTMWLLRSHQDKFEGDWKATK
ncbi:AVR4 protein, partial [Columbina picui]|nr:AVR4 protein [Columbina picui]